MSSATSLAAYGSIQSATPSIRDQILGFITARAERGATREEIGHALGIKHQSVNGRLRELEDDNLIANTWRTRTQSSGRMAYIWVEARFAPDLEDEKPKRKKRKAKAKRRTRRNDQQLRLF